MSVVSKGGQVLGLFCVCTCVCVCARVCAHVKSEAVLGSGDFCIKCHVLNIETQEAIYAFWSITIGLTDPNSEPPASTDFFFFSSWSTWFYLKVHLDFSLPVFPATAGVSAVWIRSCISWSSRCKGPRGGGRRHLLSEGPCPWLTTPLLPSWNAQPFLNEGSHVFTWPWALSMTELVPILVRVNWASTLHGCGALEGDLPVGCSVSSLSFLKTRPWSTLFPFPSS